MEVVVKRPAAEVAAFCQLLPGVWRSVCADVKHTCLPRFILLNEPASPEKVTVLLDGDSKALPNIHPQLLLLA